MFEIKLYLKKTNPRTDDNYFIPANNNSIDNNDLIDLKNRRYTHGKVVLSCNSRILLDEECELDFFISCIQDDKEAILSGKMHVIDNSYFKLLFKYQGKLTISFDAKSCSVDKQEFIKVFLSAAEAYYKLLAGIKQDKQYYEEQLDRLRAEWSS